VGGLKYLGSCGALDLVFLRVRGCRATRTRGCRGAATRPGLTARKSLASKNPMSGSGPSESARLKGEQPVEGVRNPEDGRCRVLDDPGHTDPFADVAEGEENPRRGVPVRQDRGGCSGPNPERAMKPEGAAGRSSDRTAGRTTEYLAVVQTTRRGWRTNVAATWCGALREAVQP
jgi:hypothetical protein